MAEHVYDSSDSCTGKSAVQEPLEYSIYGLLKKYQITITTAESATGGMIASTLINDNDRIGYGKCFFLIMGNEYERDAKLIFQADQLVLHVLAQL